MSIKLITSVMIIFISCYDARSATACQAPPDHDWYANSVINQAHSETIDKIGYCQGVSRNQDCYYFYGDDKLNEPRMGIIREFKLASTPVKEQSNSSKFAETGRVIKLTQNSKPMILHPTGLTWHETFGCYLGDTVNKVATIYKLNWELALKEGNLDHAIERVISDNAAINGCRPCFVHSDQTYLATADYGKNTPMLRLYDPQKLSTAYATSEPGVLVKQFPIGAFNQNLFWDAEQKEIICIQNVIEGRGWQLEYLNLKQMLNGWDSNSAVVKRQRLTFTPHDELEGFLMLDQAEGLFCTSSLVNNVTTGKMKLVAPYVSRAK